MADARRESFEEPDVRTRAGQIDVTQTLAPHLCLRDLNPALVADHSPVLHALVLSAEAFPVGHGPEYARAEKSIALWLKRAVIDRLRFGYFPVRPMPDLLR